MNLSNIINEELKKVLNESYAFDSDNFSFTQQVPNSSFYNYDSLSSDYDTDIDESLVSVTWRINFWLNEMGVNNLDVVISSISGTYKLTLLNRQSDEVEQATDRDINEIKWKFIIENVSMTIGTGLYIQELEFDFATKQCTVKF